VIHASGGSAARTSRALKLRMSDEGWKHLSPKPCWIRVDIIQGLDECSTIVMWTCETEVLITNRTD
jgi:hypothetical protein